MCWQRDIRSACADCRAPLGREAFVTPCWAADNAPAPLRRCEDDNGGGATGEAHGVCEGCREWAREKALANRHGRIYTIKQQKAVGRSRMMYLHKYRETLEKRRSNKNQVSEELDKKVMEVLDEKVMEELMEEELVIMERWRAIGQTGKSREVSEGVGAEGEKEAGPL